MFRVGFSGHRPTKLGGYNVNSEKNKLLYNITITLLDRLFSQHVDKIYTHHGGALGFDQMSFYACDALKSDHDIFTEIDIPFKDQPNKWPAPSQVEYTSMLDRADKLVYVDETKGYVQKPVGSYAMSKLFTRNKFIVDNCDLLVTMWDGSDGGTKHCLTCAKAFKKEIINIDPQTLKIENLSFGKRR